MELFVTSIGDPEPKFHRPSSPGTSGPRGVVGTNYLASRNNTSAASGTRKETYPTIHFGGRSSSSNGNSATLSGTVRMGEDGTIRWSWVGAIVCFSFSFSWPREFLVCEDVLMSAAL